MSYPLAFRDDEVEYLHGRAVHDPYRWMESDDDPRTVEWCRLQERLYARHAATWSAGAHFAAVLDDLRRQEWHSVPSAFGDRLFYLHRPAGASQARLVVLRPDGRRQTVLWPGSTHGGADTVLHTCHPSPTGRLLTYQLSPDGSETAPLDVIDVDSGRAVDRLGGRIRSTSLVWTPDETGFYYVRQEPRPTGTGFKPAAVYHHQLGTTARHDRIVFGTDRPEGERYRLHQPAGTGWLILHAQRDVMRTHGLWLADLGADPAGSEQLRAAYQGAPVRLAVRALPGAGTTEFLVCTTAGSPRGRLCRVTAAQMFDGDWATLVDSRPDVVMEEVAALGTGATGHETLVIQWSDGDGSELTIHSSRDGSIIDRVPLPDSGVVEGLSSRPESSQVWFSYSDTLRSPNTYLFDAGTGRTTIWTPTTGVKNRPLAHRPVQQLRATCTSRDGTPVDLSIVAPLGPRSETLPTIVTAYGGFGVTQRARYSSAPVAWAEAGGAFVTAHVRGGGEKGDEWHRSGRGRHKQNTFEDLRAAMAWLIESGWTTPQQLGLLGASNGGLLVGAAVTQWPDMLRAAVAIAPLLDMIRYERFGLGPQWVGEYGSVRDPEQFGWLAAYSPYHRVRPDTAYPAVLLLVLGADTRVHPMHARKMAAALQAARGAQPVLFHTVEGVGHGDTPIARSADLASETFAFFADQLGLTVSACADTGFGRGFD